MSKVLKMQVIALSFLLAGALNANASTWSTIATACTPDRGSIQTDRYRSFSDRGILHRSGVLDKIILICPVEIDFGPADPFFNTLSLTALDTTGAGTQAHVKAQLISVAMFDGERNIIATVSSDSNPDTAISSTPAVFTHSFSATNYYYVRIELDRSSTSENVIAIGVSLSALLS